MFLEYSFCSWKILGVSIEMVSPLKLLCLKNSHKELRKLFVQTAFLWVGGVWVGCLPLTDDVLRAGWLGVKNWTHIYFSLTFRVPRDIPPKIPGYPAQEIGFPAFRGTYRTFWPFTWKTPAPPEDIRTKRSGLGSFIHCTRKTMR